MRTVLFGLLFSVVLQARAQSELPFKAVTPNDFAMRTYSLDTAADAIVLDEQGYAEIDLDGSGQPTYEYYTKIKILKKNGLDEADFQIVLSKTEKHKEKFEWVMASTYNYDGVTMKESKLDPLKTFVENFSDYNLQKFTLPDVRVGSIIEVKYKISSPFVYNFFPWHFQSERPKLRSLYRIRIPANYYYNVVLRGFLKMTTNKVSAFENCFVSPDGGKGTCTLMQFGMENIPAFVEEDYATAKSNFLSAIYFELNTITHFDGKVKKFTEEWGDVDKALQYDDRFGPQLKKAAELLPDSVVLACSQTTDEIKNARHIYNFVADYFTWDEENGLFTDAGVKKLYEKKKGNCADINLTLVGSLQKVGLKAWPVILSTRRHGSITELHPEISGFNYVIAAVDIGETRHLLDATSNILPFGVLPLRCLNGRGRLIDVRESTFVDLKPIQKFKSSTVLELTMAADGMCTGKITVTSAGYNGIDKRTKILEENKQEDYVKSLRKDWEGAEISNYEVTNLHEADKPLIEKATLILELQSAGGAGLIYFNPFFTSRLNKNPFKSAERLYPVDYGAPIDNTFILSLSIPPSFTIDEIPKSVGLALPQGGGKFTMNASQASGKISVVSNLTLAKQLYDPTEYHFLKELYARILQVQESQIVLKTK